MADMEWLRRRSREVTRELEALPAWEREWLHAQLLELGKPREQAAERDSQSERGRDAAACRSPAGTAADA